MKFLEDMFHKAKPMFTKGGKFERLYPMFEAKESFCFATDKRTDTGAHVRDPIDLKRMMITVVLAVIPCLLFGIWNTGHNTLLASSHAADAGNILACALEGAKKVLPLLLVVYATGGIVEMGNCIIRKHEINEGFLVTGMLITLTLPPTMPLWLASLATIFGVLVGKELFGGTGFNILNPALTARAFLFFAYPTTISGDQCWVAQEGFTSLTSFKSLGVSQATPLGQAGQNLPVSQSLTDMFLGFEPGSIGETSALCCLIGAAILILSGVGSWRIIISGLIGAAVCAGLASFTSTAQDFPNSIHALGIAKHLCMGGLAFGLVFMATDPVSAAATNTGKWIYGFLCGFIAILIRIVNPGYPEGVMLAILFMNSCAPLLDYYVVKANVKRRLARV